jgi:Protein of unknown function (DUF3300)
VYDDSPPSQQVAQEEPPPQDMAPAQPYERQPAPHVQALPRYYGQPNQQAYPQPQQNDGQQDQQNYAAPQPQQNYGQQDNGAQAEQDYPQDDYGPSAGQAGQAAQQPLSPEQLEQLVAPIALYPDQLVAQILTASTYPAQLTAADQLVRSMNGAAPEQIAQSANAQAAWDPSVKALTAFPQVLAMLDSNLQWTAALGNSYYNQPKDVLETIQVLRQRAEQSGNLQSTPQEQVVQQPNYIQIQPADPEYVYVPSYNPWYAYGQPIEPYPSFGFGNWGLYTGGGVEYGLGFAVAPYYGMPYAFGAWGLDWMGCAVLFNHGGYWTHSREVRDWGFAHGGRRWNGGGGWGRGGYGGRDYARFGGYHNQPLDVHNGNGFNRSPVNRGFGGPQPMRPVAPGLQAYGHMPPAVGRPEPFQGRPQQPYGGQSFTGRPPMQGGPQPFRGQPQTFAPRQEPYRGQPQQFSPMPRPGNGFSGYPRPGQGFAGRPAPMQPYRAPQQNYAPRAFAGGSNGWGQSYARPQQPSRSFMGGGHSAPSYGGGGRAFSGGSPSFGGGGRSFGGGGGHSFGGGGGHSSGGGGGRGGRR